MEQRFCKEVMTWKGLRHQNVLSLLGVMISGNQLMMASEWMANGNLNEFVKTHRDANRFKLVGFCSCCRSYLSLMRLFLIACRCRSRVDIYARSGDGTRGLERGMILDASHHTFPNVSRIKVNIMIDKGSNAQLADFGLLTIVSDSTHSAATISSEGSGTFRFMSPELLDPEEFGFKNARPTKQSDCYALGMVILEALTGRAPFPSCDALAATRKVIKGERPDRPQGPEAVWFADDLWGMLEQCWLQTPKLRPAVEDVLECLEQYLETWKPLPPSTDSDPQVDSDNETWKPLLLNTDNDPQADSDNDSAFEMIRHSRGSLHPVFLIWTHRRNGPCSG